MSTLYAAAAAGLIVPALTFALVLMVAQAKDNCGEPHGSRESPSSPALKLAAHLSNARLTRNGGASRRPLRRNPTP